MRYLSKPFLFSTEGFSQCYKGRKQIKGIKITKKIIIYRGRDFVCRKTEDYKFLE